MVSAEALGIANIVLAIGSVLFTVALLPSLFKKETAIPVSTSALTASVLWVYVGIYVMLGLDFSSVAGASTALIWTLLLVLRRPKQVK